jgi:hypothetical protein
VIGGFAISGLALLDEDSIAEPSAAIAGATGIVSGRAAVLMQEKH